MEKRYFCLIYLVLLAFGIRKKVAAASIMNVLLTWKDHMFFIFNSVETSRAMDKIDVFVPFFTLCIFLIIEVVGIYYFWKQEHAVIYKIRLGNILNVLCVKYLFAVLTALKYYFITVGESLLFGRGDNDYLNSYETVQILL